MIVYVVTHGQYSGYHIEAVFHDKEQAELFCAVRNSDEDDFGEYDIEEFDTEEYKMNAADPIHSMWRFNIPEKDASKLWLVGYCYTTKTVNDVREEVFGYQRCDRVTVTLRKDATLEQAEKAARDRYEEWKYNKFA